MKISARNIIPGTIVEVKRGATTSHVRLDIGGGNIITSSITNEAVDDLKLVVGGKASAVMTSTRSSGPITTPVFDFRCMANQIILIGSSGVTEKSL